MIDVTHLNAHRAATGLLEKGLFPVYLTHNKKS